MDTIELENFFKRYMRLKEQAISKLDRFENSCKKEPIGDKENSQYRYASILGFISRKPFLLEFTLFDEKFILKAEINPNEEAQHILFNTYSVVSSEENHLNEKWVLIDNMRIRLDDGGNIKYTNREDALWGFDSTYVDVLCDYVKSIFAKRVVDVQVEQ